MQKRNYGFLPLLAAVILLAGLPIVAHAQGTMFVQGNNVGIGISAPTEPLHIESTAARLLVNNTNAAVAAREVGTFENNGGSFFVLRDFSIPTSYSVATAGNFFFIDQQQLAGIEFLMDTLGNVTITGALAQGSSRTIKDNFQPVSASGVLKSLERLPLMKWSYKADDTRSQHFGPMAEDFYSVFGLGSDDRHIAPADMAGVALAAVQGLNQEIELRDERISALETRLLALEKLIK